LVGAFIASADELPFSRGEVGHNGHAWDALFFLSSGEDGDVFLAENTEGRFSSDFGPNMFSDSEDGGGSFDRNDSAPPLDRTVAVAAVPEPLSIILLGSVVLYISSRIRRTQRRSVD